MDNLLKISSRRSNIFVGILFLVFSKSGIQYLWQKEISVCKVLYWRIFYWKKCGAYINYELIVRLIPTWIWYDLLTVSHFWPSTHQLSYFFKSYQLKLAQQLESFALQSVVLMLLDVLWTSKIQKANQSSLITFTWEEWNTF